MPELTFKPVRHDHERFMTRARKRRGFAEAYDALALEYQLAGQMLKARARAGQKRAAAAHQKPKAFQTRSVDLGRCLSGHVDAVAKVLIRAEGEFFR